MKPIVTVLSSFAKDTLVDSEGNVLKIQNGGPAFFIERVFQQEKIDHILRAGAPLEVEILVTPKEEFGRIRRQPKPRTIKAPDTPFLFISTILNEWPLQVKNYRGLVFIDIQGFVRDGRFFGKKKMLKVPDDFSPFCIKGTEEEIRHLPKEFIEAQKKRCLVITKKKHGSTIFYRQEKHEFRPQRIVQVQHAVGAGDVFFAAFFSKFAKTKNVSRSGTFATKAARAFLELS